MTTRKATTRSERKLDARPDTLDFRDLMYVPTLIEVPSEIALDDYRRYEVPVLDQGTEGACTGFGLATVAHYLLRRRKVVRDTTCVSPRMLYEMAKRYDDWPGEDYSGSSARGAMKGWHKHGVCSADDWPYKPGRDASGLTKARTADAVRRPLGAYFRVNHTDLVAMHSAIAEVGVLYATAMVHAGWEHPDKSGHIEQSDAITGGHAFAIVAYDRHGLWVQNSWGPKWGKDGLARVSYDDWLANGTDVWVARLGAAVTLKETESAAAAHAATAGESIAYSFADLRPHIVSIGDQGKLKPGGDYGTSQADVRRIFDESMPAAMESWSGAKRVLLYAHGGLVSESSLAQHVAEYRAPLLAANVYPIAFAWHSDYWTTIQNILRDALARRRPEGALDATKDFMLDRLDDALEPVARALSGKAAWDEMKRNALAATESEDGGARFTADALCDFLTKHKGVTVHLVGHSAGSIFHAPLVRHLRERGVAVESCTLWAPACTVDVFNQYYAPSLPDHIRRFALYALTDQAEQDDNCAEIYHKSLLYLVSNAFEDKPRIPLARDGVPILGMEKFIDADSSLAALLKRDGASLVLAPNTNAADSDGASTARHHGDFDDDPATVKSTLMRILGRSSERAAAAPVFRFRRSEARLSARRADLQRQSAPRY